MITCVDRAAHRSLCHDCKNRRLVHPKPPLAFQACGHTATGVIPERRRLIGDRDSFKRQQHTIPARASLGPDDDPLARLAAFAQP